MPQRMDTHPDETRVVAEGGLERLRELQCVLAAVQIESTITSPPKQHCSS